MTRPLQRVVPVEPFAVQIREAREMGFGSEQELWRRMAIPDHDDPEYLPSYLIGGLRLIKLEDLKKIFDKAPDPFTLAAKRFRGVKECDPQLLDRGFDDLPQLAEAG